jgi:hypothetical protein
MTSSLGFGAGWAWEGSEAVFEEEFGSPDREEKKNPKKVLKERKSGMREDFIKTLITYLRQHQKRI